MSGEVKLLKGVVRDTNVPSAFQYVRLYGGRAQASNGIVTLDVPYECGGLDVTVHGAKFIAAVTRCDAPAFKVMPSGRLQVREGSFKISLPLLDNKLFPLVIPKGVKFGACDYMLEAFKIAKPFTGGERIWLNGVHLRGGYVYATNGFSMVRVKIGYEVEVAGTVPIVAVAKIIAIKQPIAGMRVAENAVMFKLGESIWLRASLITEKAPDMSRHMVDCDVPVPDGLREAVDLLVPFFEGALPVVELNDAGLRLRGDSDITVDMLGLPDAKFRGDLLRDVLEVAKYADFSMWPAACPYNDGDRVYGAIAGIAT